MTNKSWNIIVEDYNKNTNALENIVQSRWEDFFADSFVFNGYSKIRGEIHRPILKSGSGTVQPDIVIRDGGTNTDLFVFEMKQYHLSHSVSFEEQLLSYMKLLGLNVGVLVCQTIRVYYMYSDRTVISTEIPFVRDSAKGEEFVDLFKKGNFDKNKVEAFIKSHNAKKQRIAQIKQKMQSLTFEQLLIEHFLNDYSEDEIKEAISGMNSSVSTTAKPDTNGPNGDSPTLNIPTTSSEYAEPNFQYIIIKIKESTVSSRGSLYEAVRYAWLATLEKVSGYKYVFAVINGVVKGVFVANIWQYDTHGRPNRVEFIGEKAPTEISAQFVNRSIPAKYRKPGMASPILFSKN